MKNILILGCSFTAGSYQSLSKKLSKNVLSLSPNLIPKDELILPRHGWWYFVDYFKDNNVTVIAFFAQGYWAYYQILLYLEEQNKLEYDEIWIQETLEPRATINNYKDISSQFELNDRYIINETFKLFDIDSYLMFSLNPWSCKKEHEPYSLWHSFFNEITKLCAKNIDKLCAEKNIKGYVWSMDNSVMKCEHFTRLPLIHMRTELKDNNLLVPGTFDGLHQTEDGNKYIGKLIDKYV